MLVERESGHLDRPDALARPGLAGFPSRARARVPAERLDPWLARWIAPGERHSHMGKQCSCLHPALVNRSLAGVVAPASGYGAACSGEHDRAGNSCCVPWGKQHCLARAAALLASGGGASRSCAEPGWAHHRTRGRLDASRRCRSHRAHLLPPPVGTRLPPLRLLSPAQVGECGCVLDWQILDCGPLATATGPAHAALALVVVLLARTLPGLPGVSAPQLPRRWQRGDPGGCLGSGADAFRGKPRRDAYAGQAGLAAWRVARDSGTGYGLAVCRPQCHRFSRSIGAGLQAISCTHPGAVHADGDGRGPGRPRSAVPPGPLVASSEPGGVHAGWCGVGHSAATAEASVRCGGSGTTPPLAHTKLEACVTRLFATVEGVLMALFAPLLGWLIDESRSVDTILVMVGLVFALGLACSLLALGASFRQPARTQRTTTRLVVALEA